MGNVFEIFRHMEETFPVLSKTLSVYSEALAKEDGYAERAGEIIDYINELSARLRIDSDDLDDSFCDFCIEFLKEQAAFQKTNTYSASGKGFEAIIEEVYENDQYMVDYMLGYLLSCALFPHHYRQYTYFMDVYIPSIKGGRNCCECGVGHGMYLGNVLKAYPGMRGEGYDVAESCLRIATQTMDLYGIGRDRFTVEKKDIVEHFRGSKEKYDAVIASGLLEHIENPAGLLVNIARCMSPEGRLFTMVPTNLSHPDHLIHFTTVDEIRSIFDQAGLVSIDEQVISIDAESTGRYKSVMHLCISAPQG